MAWRVNRRTASRRSGSGAGPRAASLASCMSTQRWHRWCAATARMTVSRECGSSVVDSNRALSFRNPSRVCGDSFMRATARAARSGRVSAAVADMAAPGGW
ncbi:hypothetical protein GCM10010286_24310 [Streptomyces toxytricini]|nr:hypothetical protein GCM10010286_24310 [Streptomyces toxytricini]